MAEGDAIEVQDLPEHIRGGSNASGDESDPMCSLELVQRRHIQRVLNFVGNSKIEAANILGISRTTLYRLLLEDKDKNKEALVSPNDGSDDGE